MDGVEIIEVATKGRGLIASRKFETGQLVLKEEAHSYVIMSAYVDKVCHFCLLATHVPGKETKTLAKCSGCNYARYCSKACQKKAWKEHKRECSALQRVHPGNPCDQTRLVARLLWKQTDSSLKEKNNLVSIESLEDHLNKRNKNEREALEEKVFSFGDYFTYDEMPDSDEEMLHLFATIDCNAVGLNDSKGLQAIGVGMFPTASLLNHDCNPNCVAINNGYKLEIHAMRRIEPNEELCICYIDCLETTEARREKLMKQYYFECHCEMCDNGEEIESLKHGLLKPDTKEESVKYITQFSRDMLKRIQHAKEKQNWGRMSNQAMGTLAQQDCVLADTHVLKLAILNHAVEVQSFLRRNESALELGERVAAAYEKLLPPIHPSLGMYLMRLGVLKWQLQKNEEANKTLGRAANIISKTFGDEHPIFEELLGLIKQCRIESHMSKNAQREFRLAKKKAGLGLPSAV